MSSHPLHIHFQTDHSALADSGRVPSTSANKIRHCLSTILVISSEDIRESIIQGKEEALTIIPLRPVDIDARDKDPRYFLNHPLVVATITTGSRQPQILERIARFEYLQHSMLPMESGDGGLMLVGTKWRMTLASLGRPI